MPIWVFTTGMEHDTFAGDRKTVYAVVRALEIVSEASRRLPVELKGRHPEIDWIAVAAAGNGAARAACAPRRCPERVGTRGRLRPPRPTRGSS